MCPCYGTFEGLSYNNHASSFVSKNKSMIVLCVLISGGLHPTLVLLSSNMFGMNIFCSEMSIFELNEYFGLRIVLNTLFENIPQIIIQCTYLITINVNIFNDLTTLISFVFSALSIIISVIVFVINFTEITEGSVCQFVSFFLFFFLCFCFVFFGFFIKKNYMLCFKTLSHKTKRQTKYKTTDKLFYVGMQASISHKSNKLNRRL